MGTAFILLPHHHRAYVFLIIPNITQSWWYLILVIIISLNIRNAQFFSYRNWLFVIFDKCLIKPFSPGTVNCLLLYSLCSLNILVSSFSNLFMIHKFFSHHRLSCHFGLLLLLYKSFLAWCSFFHMFYSDTNTIWLQLYMES